MFSIGVEGEAEEVEGRMGIPGVNGKYGTGDGMLVPDVSSGGVIPGTGILLIDLDKRGIGVEVIRSDEQSVRSGKTRWVRRRVFFRTFTLKGWSAL